MVHPTYSKDVSGVTILLIIKIMYALDSVLGKLCNETNEKGYDKNRHHFQVKYLFRHFHTSYNGIIYFFVTRKVTSINYVPNCLQATDCICWGIPFALIIAWYASFARSNFDCISNKCAMWNWTAERETLLVINHHCIWSI